MDCFPRADGIGIRHVVRRSDQTSDQSSQEDEFHLDPIDVPTAVAAERMTLAVVRPHDKPAQHMDMSMSTSFMRQSTVAQAR
jgi:hypothetical protein